MRLEGLQLIAPKCFDLLQPVAQLVEGALTTPSPAVQRAAVAAAGNAAQRRGDVYQETLSKALTSPDPELRRIAFAAVRSAPGTGNPEVGRIPPGTCGGGRRSR